MTDALKFYASLNIDNDTTHQQKWIKFCNSTYSTLLDDYIYIVENYQMGYNLKQIHDILKNDKEFESCDFMQCKCLLRHVSSKAYEEPSTDTIIFGSNDTNFVFYKNIFDSMHCHLIHLYDVGMRISLDDENIEIKAENEEFEQNWVDQQFLKIAAFINKKKKKLMSSTVLKNAFSINKFNIHSDHDNINEEKDETFMDRLLVVIFDKLERTDLNVIMNYLKCEEYDSDAIKEDIRREIYNIANVDQYGFCAQFIRSFLLSDKTFRTGFRFNYWYVNHIEDDDTGGTNMRYYNGYKQAQFFVKAKYTSLKEELISNKIFPMKLYQYNVTTNKVTKYMNAAKVRGMTSYETYNGNYGIKPRTPISFTHLMSIVLRTDWNDLCTAFSATFRAKDPFDTMKSVISRNSEFANWSRALRETVEIFGEKTFGNEWHNSNAEPLKLYCGISHIMAMPEFHIRLNCPLSTTGTLEVAQTFATSNGMLIHFANGLTYHELAIRSFYCGWISQYASEDEHLFTGGKWRLKIYGITFQHNGQNFAPFFKALFFFDCMLNGSKMYWDGNEIPKMDKEDYIKLKNLIQHKINSNAFRNEYPEYINDTFEAYTNNKKQIILNLHWIHRYFTEIETLILYTLADGEVDETLVYRYNLFKPIIFELFPNLVDIKMYCAYTGHDMQMEDEYDQHPMNLNLFVPIIKSCSMFITPSLTISIKAVHPYMLLGAFEVGDSWIVNFFDEKTERDFIEADIFVYLTQTSFGKEKLMTAPDGSVLLFPKKIEDCLIIKPKKSYCSDIAK
eukprot:496526_1